MVMAFGLTGVGCQASGQATEGPSVAQVKGTSLAAVPVYVRLPVPLSAASVHTTRLSPTPDGARSDTIGTAPQEGVWVTDATVRRSGHQWSVSIHVMDNPQPAAASLAGGHFAVALDEKTVVPLLGPAKRLAR